MKLSHRITSSIAALGLVITTTTTATPTQIASAGPLPDVAVKYTGYSYGANGLIDVAFDITSKDAAANNIKLETTCNYRNKTTDVSTNSSKGQIMLSLPQPQQTPVPKLVTCSPSSTDYVSSVFMQAVVTGGDSVPANNGAYFDAFTNVPHPDVAVAYGGRQKFASGQVNALFALMDTQADAPVVNLVGTCNYRNSATNAFVTALTQTETVSLIKNQSPGSKWVKCVAQPGMFVSSVTLHASVVKPYNDPNNANNTAYWDTNKG